MTRATAVPAPTSVELGELAGMNLRIRLTGDEELVRKFGDKIITLLESEGYKEISDTGANPSRKEKYKGSYIRYISIS